MVVAILATISFVTYRGIRERAVTVAYTSAVDHWDKFLRIEASLAGDLPSISTCVGKASTDFPNQDGFAAGVCFRGTNGVSVSYNAAFFNSLETNGSQSSGILPITTVTLAGVGTYTSRGILLDTYPASRYYSLQWVPQVAGQCSRGTSTAGTPGALSGGMCSLVSYY